MVGLQWPVSGARCPVRYTAGDWAPSTGHCLSFARPLHRMKTPRGSSPSTKSSDSFWIEAGKLDGVERRNNTRAHVADDPFCTHTALAAVVFDFEVVRRWHTAPWLRAGRSCPITSQNLEAGVALRRRHQSRAAVTRVTRRNLFHSSRVAPDADRNLCRTSHVGVRRAARGRDGAEVDCIRS
jgi:hypothetical protein